MALNNPFQIAYNQTMGFEGGAVDNPLDRGGATLNGISSKWWPQEYAQLKSLVDAGKLDEAEQYKMQFYKNNFWDKIGGDELPPEIAPLAFDAAVQHGVSGAQNLLAQAGNDPAKLLDARKNLMGEIVANDPTQKEFEKGWLNRVNAQMQDVIPAALGDGEFIEVETPDGIVEFPSNMSNSEIEAVLQNLYPPQNTTPQAAAPEGETQPENFWQRMGGDLERRSRQLGEIYSAEGERNEQVLLDDIYQTGGVAIGAAGDVVGNLATSGYRQLPQTVRGEIERMGGAALGALGKLPSAGGGTLAEAIPQELGRVGGSYDSFSEENPRFARNINATANYLSLFPQIKATKYLGKLEDVGKKVTKRADDILPKVKQLTANDLAKESQKAYAKAARLGGELPDDMIDDWADDVMTKIIPQTEQARILAGKNPEIEAVLDRMGQMPKTKTSLQAFDEMDKWLGQKARDNFDAAKGGFNDTGRQIKLIQESLRDQVENFNPKDMSKEGFEALKEARSLWSRKIKLRNIEDIAYKAEMSLNPQTAIRGGLKTLLSNPKKMAGYTAAERAAMEKAAKSGLRADLMRPFTSRLTAIGGAVTTDPLTAFSMNLGGIAARGVRDDMAARQLGRIGQMIAGQSSVVLPEAGLVGAAGQVRALGTGLQGLGRIGGAYDKYRGANLTGLGLLNQQTQQQNQ